MKRILAVLMVLSLVTFVSGQSLKIGLGGGLMNFTAPAGFTDEYPNGIGFGMEPMINFKGKLGLPVLPLDLTASINYVMLGSEGKGDAPVHTVEISGSLIQYGVGAEYSLIPGPLPIKPYISFDILVNNFGEMTYKYDWESNSIPDSEQKSASFSRTGIAIGAGVDLKTPFADLNANVKYHINNLIGKEDGEDTISSLSLGVMILFSVL
ncbi:MAG: outer membrane beta-barrel protein [Ignavibacteriaceae bacterium]